MANALEATQVVAVVGAGAMGAGIAQIAVQAGHPVKLYDQRPEAAANAIATIGQNFDKLSQKGRMGAGAAKAAVQRLHVAHSVEDLADAGLVIEAIAEDLELKRRLFVALERVTDSACILATNTSSISVTSIAAALAQPERLVGMHFFNPAPVMVLVEVVSGLATSAETAQAVFATAAKWGKKPVHAKSTPGFIVNRVARPFYAEGLRLLTEQAADYATLDAVMRESGGFRMGPFELMDLIGHDVNFAVTRSVFEAYFNDPRFTPSLVQQELVNAGYLGRKSGRGFYCYEEGADAPTPQTEGAQPRPGQVCLHPAGALAEAMATRLRAAGVPFTMAPEPHADGRVLALNDAVVYLTDGRSATERATDNGVANTVLIDLALDYTEATRIALAKADACSERAFLSVVGLFQSAGFAVSRLNDVPGMAVMRTVAMLANEAADVVYQGVCSAQAVDIAMRGGVNYPRGPLAWADAMGPDAVRAVLDHLARFYGEDRYRTSPLLRRKALSAATFHVA